MKLYNFVSILLLYVLFFVYIHCKEPEYTPFGEASLSKVPNGTYKKVFTIKVNSSSELKKALEIGLKKYFELLGLKYEKSSEDKIKSENDKLKLNQLNASLFFHAQTYAISKEFTALKILFPNNTDDLAEEYVKFLNEAAKSVKGPYNLTVTFIAMVTSSANLMKAHNVTSEKSVKQIIKYFDEEMDKYRD